MAFRALVTVGSYPLPEPSTYIGLTATMVDSGRNLEGVTIGSVVRDDVAKVEMTWKFLSASEWSNILKLFKISAGGKFYNTVTFFDQTENGWVTRTMYVGDRTSGGMFRRDSITGDVIGWTEPKLSLVEA